MKNKPRFTSLSRLVLAGSAALLLCPSARAAEATWDNTGTDFNLNTSWAGDVGPVTGGTAIFADAPVTSPNLSASISLERLHFAPAGYTITSSNGAAFTLGTANTNTTVVTGSNTTGTNTIDADLVLTSGTKTIGQAGGGTMVLSGDISETGEAGALYLTRIGAASGVSTFTLSGNNTFTGGITLAAAGGILNIGSATALGSGTLKVASTSGFSIYNTSGSAQTLGNDILISGNAANFYSSDLTFTGSVTLANAQVTLGAFNNTITFTGAIGEDATGGRGLRKDGLGTLILGDANTYSGATLISGGTLSISKIGNSSSVSSSLGAGSSVFRLGAGSSGNGSTLLYTGAGETTDRVIELNYASSSTAIQNDGTGALILSNITNTVVGTKILVLAGSNRDNNTIQSGIADTNLATAKITNLTKNGVGTWVLSGVNTYTGATTINGGKLVLDMNAGGALAATTAMNLGGELSVLGKSSGDTVQTTGNMVITGTTGSTITLNPNGGNSTTLTLGTGAWTRRTAATLNIDLSSTAGGAMMLAAPTSGISAAEQTAAQALFGWATVKDATGIGFAANVGGNMVRYTGAAVFDAATNNNGVNYAYTAGGALNMANTNHVTKSLSIDTTAGETVIDLGGETNLLSFANLALLMTGNNNATIQNGLVGASNVELAVHTMGSGVLSINAPVSGGTGLLVKNGQGTLVLGGTNNYSGITSINEGMLKFAKKASLYNGDTASWTSTKIKVAADSTLALNVGGTGEFAESDVATVLAMVSGSTAGFREGSFIGLDTTNAVGGNFEYTGAIANAYTSSNLGLTKLGSNTLTLTAANTYTGDTNVSAGRLNVNGSLAAKSAVKVASGATLGGSGTVNGNVAVTGGTVDGSNLKLNGATTFTGASFLAGTTTASSISVSSGTTTISGATTATGGITTGTNSTLKVNGSVDGAVTVSGTLGGIGTISGATTVIGTLAPGNSIGTLNTEDLTLTATSIFDVELGRNGGLATSDRANVTGSVNIATGADLKLTLSGTTPETSDIFFLINNDLDDAIIGTFSSLGGVVQTLTEGSQFSWNDQEWKITYQADAGTTSFTQGNDLAIMVVPEPSTWALLTGGVGMLFAMQGMRRRSRVS